MPFYLVRRKIFAVLRMLCAAVCALGLAFACLGNAREWLDERVAAGLEASLPSADLPLNPNPQDKVVAWRAIERYGDISRHHRLASAKNQLWWALIQDPLDKSQESLNHSLGAWLEKNERNLDMQLAYARWLHSGGKEKKALKRVLPLAEKFSAHQELVNQVAEWTKEANASINQTLVHRDSETRLYMESIP